MQFFNDVYMYEIIDSLVRYMFIELSVIWWLYYQYLYIYSYDWEMNDLFFPHGLFNTLSLQRWKIAKCTNSFLEITKLLNLFVFWK